MVVDVYKIFKNLIDTKYYKEHYFVDTCKPFTSRFTDLTNLDSAGLKIYLEEHNKVNDCGQIRNYCELNVFDEIKLSDIEGKIVAPFKKTVIKNTEINYITHNDVWENEQF